MRPTRLFDCRYTTTTVARASSHRTPYQSHSVPGALRQPPLLVQLLPPAESYSARRALRSAAGTAAAASRAPSANANRPRTARRPLDMSHLDCWAILSAWRSIGGAGAGRVAAGIVSPTVQFDG